MEKVSPGTVLSNRCTSVDLPEPDGAEMMKTLVMRRSLEVQRLLPDFLDSGLPRQRQIGDPQTQLADAVGLRQHGVGFAIHLLQQEVDLLAYFAAGIEDLAQLPRMN